MKAPHTPSELLKFIKDLPTPKIQNFLENGGEHDNYARISRLANDLQDMQFAEMMTAYLTLDVRITTIHLTAMRMDAAYTGKPTLPELEADIAAQLSTLKFYMAAEGINIPRWFGEKA